jgi:hypothetical protein
MSSATPLRDAIVIPESVSANDYVLKLTEGVSHAEETLRQYVVTPELAHNFDQALSLIGGALEKGRSDGAFLHGSFGSGKSHFMAVLHEILGHNPVARSLPGLESVVAQHDNWLADRRILRLTYHLIGAESLEKAIFSGYVDQIRRLHPRAPLPEVHVTDSLLSDADRFRSTMGDEKFFAGLGETALETGGWGTLAAGWDATTYDAARWAEPTDPERMRLVSELVEAYFKSFPLSARYVDLDRGLAAISAHAQALEYDVVVMFLDELVLWLASRISDPAFVASEGSKVAKLVESADARRPVPLVSFIARQRDLKDFLGEHVSGSEKLAFGETFRWWEDRFNRITLEDRNLPVIVEKRILRPKDDGDPEALRKAFDSLTRDPKVWNVLLEGLDTDGRGGADQEAFGRTYPFSPALISTLVVLSGLLQRERTALKVLQQMLVDGRKELTVKDLIPVGDLFDALVGSGEVALTDEIRQHFTNARTLYADKLRPRVLARHELDDESAVDLPRLHPFRTDDRLVKTLLLSALAPQVSALRNLTAAKLAALNHGTIATPLPGTESVRVVELFKSLYGDVGEVRLSDDPANPLITIELANVDYESVVERVRNVDNIGERRRLLRELVFESLGVETRDTLTSEHQHTVVWRGSRRTIDVIFGNVRDANELPDNVLMAVDGRWKILIDFPFDVERRSPNDDHARIEKLLGQGVTSSTVCWIPAFFTEERMSDIGDLVCLNYLLASTDRFESNASHLSVQGRAQAKVILQNRQAALRQRLLGVIQQAYGAAKPQPADIDHSYGEPRWLATLDPTFSPGAPVGARMADAFTHLIDQMHAHTYPAHPMFEAEVRRTDLNKVLDHVRRAVAEGGRISVDHAQRATLARICNRLDVGEMLESHFLFDATTFPWRDRFGQLAAQEGLDSAIPVSALLAWTDEPRPRGLDPLVRNLLVAAYALITDRAWFIHGSAVPMPPLEQIKAEHELREPRLPDAEDWRQAVPRAARLLGVHSPELRSATNLSAVASQVRAKASALAPTARDLVGLLDSHASDLGLDSHDTTGRLATARSAANLVERLAREEDDVALVTVLAQVGLPVADEVVARSLSSAADVSREISATQWDIIRGLAPRESTDPSARAVFDELQSAAAFDEHAKPLAPVLRSTVKAAVQIIAPPPTPALPRPVTSHRKTVPAAEIATVVDELEEFAQEHPENRITITWDLEP